MEFRGLNLRNIILFSMAGLVLIIMVISRVNAYRLSGEQSILPPASMAIRSSIPEIESNRPDHIRPADDSRIAYDSTEEDIQSMKEMKEQMDNDRLQQKKIKMLKLQLEQTNLQLEQEKAKSEINKLEKENTGVVDDSDNQGQDKYPEVKVVYIGGSDNEKEAILNINGNNYLVKEKNKPVKNVEVVSISDTAVTVHFNLPQDLSTAIEYNPE